MTSPFSLLRSISSPLLSSDLSSVSSSNSFTTFLSFDPPQADKINNALKTINKYFLTLPTSKIKYISNYHSNGYKYQLTKYYQSTVLYLIMKNPLLRLLCYVSHTGHF